MLEVRSPTAKAVWEKAWYTVFSITRTKLCFFLVGADNHQYTRNLLTAVRRIYDGWLMLDLFVSKLQDAGVSDVELG